MSEFTEISAANASNKMEKPKRGQLHLICSDPTCIILQKKNIAKIVNKISTKPNNLKLCLKRIKSCKIVSTQPLRAPKYLHCQSVYVTIADSWNSSATSYLSEVSCILSKPLT